MQTAFRSVPETAIKVLTDVIVGIDCESPLSSMIGDSVDRLAACAQWLNAYPEHAAYRKAASLIETGIRKALDPGCASLVRARKDFVVAREVLNCQTAGDQQ